MVWVLAFSMMIGEARHHVTVEPFSTLRTCEDAAKRVAMIPEAGPSTCTLKEQRPA